jgi:hypothetical protein
MSDAPRDISSRPIRGQVSYRPHMAPYLRRLARASSLSRIFRLASLMLSSSENRVFALVFSSRGTEDSAVAVFLHHLTIPRTSWSSVSGEIDRNFLISSNFFKRNSVPSLSFLRSSRTVMVDRLHPPPREASKRLRRPARNLNFKPHWNYDMAPAQHCAEQRTLPVTLSLGPRNLCMAISGPWPRTIANTQPAGRGHTTSERTPKAAQLSYWYSTGRVSELDAQVAWNHVRSRTRLVVFAASLHRREIVTRPV